MHGSFLHCSSGKVEYFYSLLQLLPQSPWLSPFPILVVDFLSKALHLSESINHGTNLGRDVVGSFIVVDDQVIAHKKHRTQ